LGPAAAGHRALRLRLLRRGLPAPWAGHARRAPPRGRLRRAEAPLRHLEAGCRTGRRALRRAVRSLHRLGAPLLGLRPHGPDHGKPRFPAPAQPHRPSGARAPRRDQDQSTPRTWPGASWPCSTRPA
jgi:hypothetical protein